MLLIIGEGEKGFTNGSLSIKLSNLDDSIGVTITDNNTKIAEKVIRKKLQYADEEVIEEQEMQHGRWVKRACFFAKFFYAFIEKGTSLPLNAQPTNDLCPLKPDSPDPCDDRYRVHADTYEAEIETINDTETKGSTSNGIPAEDIKFYNFSNLEGIRRSDFGKVVYHFPITANRFDEGFNWLQIVSKDEEGADSILMETGVIKVSSALKSEQLGLLHRESDKTSDEKYDSKAEKSEVESLTNRVNELTNTVRELSDIVNQYKTSNKYQPEARIESEVPQRTPPKGKAQ